MLTQDQLLNKLRELKPFLNQEYSVREIGLFGSYVKNKFTDESDVDLVVEFEKPVGWKFFTLQHYLEEVLQKRIDLVTLDSIKSEFKSAIVKEIRYIN